MELHEDPEKRGKQVCYLLDPECTTDKAIQLYDSWGKYYDKDYEYWNQRLDKHLDEFLDFVRISKDSRILDVAAGTGFSGQKLKDRGYTNIDALDGSIGMLEQAKVKRIYKNYIHAVLGPEPIEGVDKDTYDTVLTVGAIKKNHLTHSCLESLAAVTKPGGYIYFIASLEWAEEIREEFENKVREMQREGILRWVLMKESPEPYYEGEHALLFAFKEDITERKEQADRIVGNPKTSPEQLTKWYDLWSKTYEQDILTWGYQLDKHLDEFENFVQINKDSRILDLAAGTGLIGQKLKERGYGNIDALDGSAGMLAKAKAKGIYKNHIHALVGSQPPKKVQKGGYIYFLGGVEWLGDQREEFEDKMRKLQEEGIWRWVLMKESPHPFFQNDNTLTYAFKVLK